MPQKSHSRHSAPKFETKGWKDENQGHAQHSLSNTARSPKPQRTKERAVGVFCMVASKPAVLGISYTRVVAREMGHSDVGVLNGYWVVDDGR